MPIGRHCRPEPNGHHRRIRCSTGPIGIFIVRRGKKRAWSKQHTKNRTRGSCFSIIRSAGSIVAAIVGVMMVVMVMVTTISRHHDDGPIPAPTVMVMMVVVLCELDIFIGRGDRP